MKIQVRFHTLLYMYFLNLFPETLHVSADVNHHQVYATTSRKQVIKVKYTTEINSNLKRTAIEHFNLYTHTHTHRDGVSKK